MKNKDMSVSFLVPDTHQMTLLCVQGTNSNVTHLRSLTENQHLWERYCRIPEAHALVTQVDSGPPWNSTWLSTGTERRLGMENPPSAKYHRERMASPQGGQLMGPPCLLTSPKASLDPMQCYHRDLI